MIWGWSRLVQQKVKVFASWLLFSQWISLASLKGEKKRIPVFSQLHVMWWFPWFPLEFPFKQFPC